MLRSCFPCQLISSDLGGRPALWLPGTKLVGPNSGRKSSTAINRIFGLLGEFQSLTKLQDREKNRKMIKTRMKEILSGIAKTFGANRFILITVIGTGQSHDALPLPARRGHNEVIPLKAKAENHLRDSGLAFTIIRPGGFSNGQSSGKAKLTEDHLAFSYIARVDVANLAIEALGNDESIGKTFNAYDSDMLHLYRIFMD